MKLNRIVLFGLLVSSLSSIGFAKNKGAGTGEPMINGQKIELARYAKSYVGQGNVSVDVTHYKVDGKEVGAILLIKGVEGPWDGKAIVHEIGNAPYGGISYSTKYKGKNWETMRVYSDGSRDSELYVPESGTGDQGIKIAPSDGAAQLTSPPEIYNTYREQQHAK